MSSAICFNLDQSKILSSGDELRKLQVKERMLVTSSFSCYPLIKTYQKVSAKFDLSSANAFMMVLQETTPSSMAVS